MRVIQAKRFHMVAFKIIMKNNQNIISGVEIYLNECETFWHSGTLQVEVK